VALQLLDHEYFVAATGSIPAIKPIDGAEFEGTSRDDTDTAWSTVYYLVDYAVTSAAIKPIEGAEFEGTPTRSTTVSEYNTDTTSVEAAAAFYDGWDYKGPNAAVAQMEVLVDDNGYAAAVPSSPNPEVTSIDAIASFYDGWDYKGTISARSDVTVDDDGYTAAVTVPSSLKLEATSIDAVAGFYDGWDYRSRDAIDLHSIEATDWW
jgi:hypothetical protein